MPYERYSTKRKLRVEKRDCSSPVSFPRTVFALASVSKGFQLATLQILERLDPSIATHPNVKILTPERALSDHEKKCDGIQRFQKSRSQDSKGFVDSLRFLYF